MATLKFDDNSTIEAAITSSERELVFAVQHFSDCDAIVEKLRGGMKSLGDRSLTGKVVGAISAVTTADGVLLTATLHDTEKQQAISDITKGVVGAEDVPEDLQSIVNLARKGRDSLSDTDAASYADYFAPWSADGHVYKTGERVQYGGKLWKVASDHTSQATWTPEQAHSLFSEILPGQAGTTVGEWQQPNASNTYKTGDRVTYNGKTYESTIDNNAWSPADYPQGWTEITA